jgi:hypothetical protein
VRTIAIDRISVCLAVRAIWLWCCCAGLVACRDQRSYDDEAAALLARGSALAMRHASLQEQVDSLWDTTTAKLAEALPPDLPPVDRDIFLHARNADHIRMFMSFKDLDTTTREIVHAAGRADQALAAETRRLAEEIRRYEADKLAFLAAVGRTDEAAQRHFARQFQGIDTQAVMARKQ